MSRLSIHPLWLLPGLLAISGLVLSVAGDSLQSWLVILTLLLGLALVAVVLYARQTLRWRRQLGHLLAEAEAMLNPDEDTVQSAREPARHLSAGLNALGAALDDTRNRLREQSTLRLRAEQCLRESEERYCLAVRGAADGLFEWNLKSGQVFYSPRWKSLLGYEEHELAGRIEEWCDRIHPEDRSRLQAELDAQLHGGSEQRFDSEHRLRHRDGSWRWVLARATTIRHANGMASRMVGLITDISARKRVQEVLLDIADGLAVPSGEQALRLLVRNFAEILGVREAFICECADYPTQHVRMLAHWNKGDFAGCTEFDLAGTACEDVIREGRMLYVPRDADVRWPLERLYERHSYLGIPCLDSAGRVIGHVACADAKPMPDGLPHQAILKIFAMRAAVELERKLLERQRSALGLKSALSDLQPEQAAA